MKFTRPFRYSKEDMTVEEFVSSEMESDNCDQIDRVASQTNNVSSAFGRLVSLLVDRDLLSAEDVLMVAMGFIPERKHEYIVKKKDTEANG